MPRSCPQRKATYTHRLLSSWCYSLIENRCPSVVFSISTILSISIEGCGVGPITSSARIITHIYWCGVPLSPRRTTFVERTAGFFSICMHGDPYWARTIPLFRVVLVLDMSMHCSRMVPYNCLITLCMLHLRIWHLISAMYFLAGRHAHTSCDFDSQPSLND